MVGEELRTIYRIVAHLGDDFVRGGRECAAGEWRSGEVVIWRAKQKPAPLGAG
jgi:hypothetical protein